MLAQHGLDELRASTRWRQPLQSGSTTGSSPTSRQPTRTSSATPSATSSTCSQTLGDERGTRFEFECYDIGHLYNLAHFLDEGLVEAAALHPEHLRHPRRHRRRPREPRAHEHAPPTGCSATTTVVGARRRAPPDAVRDHGRDAWAATCASAWRTASTSAGASSPRATPSRSRKIRRILEELCCEIATPDEARAMLGLKGPDRDELLAQVTNCSRANRSRPCPTPRPFTRCIPPRARRRAIVSFVDGLRYDLLTEEVRHYARRHLLDTVGVMIAGATGDVATRAEAVVAAPAPGRQGSGAGPCAPGGPSRRRISGRHRRAWHRARRRLPAWFGALRLQPSSPPR